MKPWIVKSTQVWIDLMPFWLETEVNILKYPIVAHKEIGHEEPYYNTKILIFSFTWAGLAAFHKPSTI